MKKGKRIKTENGESRLPESVIHHIQSLLSSKEAARTTVLSKSWYKAWLTRPALDFDFTGFCNRSPDTFKEFSTKTIQRYLDSSLKIECFRLRDRFCYDLGDGYDWTPKLIEDAIKIGATDVNIELPGYTLRQEVLGSQNLVKLSVCESYICAEHVSCSRLKSLSLKLVRFTRGFDIEEMVSRCNLLEDLSLSDCHDIDMLRMSFHKYYKLRRLFLYKVSVDTEFFTDFGSKFPCLKDLSLHDIDHCVRVEIASPSLETISFLIHESLEANFDVPNIRKFTYSAHILPRFSLGKCSHEWEYDVSISYIHTFKKLSWFLILKKLLTKFRPSKISLAIGLQSFGCRLPEHKVDIEVVAEPVVVENLRINASSSFCCALLVRLFAICRPKFITVNYTDAFDFWCLYNDSLDILCKRLMQQVITPNCGIPDQTKFGQFGLKKVNVEVYEMVYTMWRPVVLKEPLDASNMSKSKQQIRFELIWD